ncbi:MAG: hypothetical protein INH37_16960, partial [Myxococcaceae bacterium]|nr:hypothetical protein [Myxococcaceae bacterium]
MAPLEPRARWHHFIEGLLHPSMRAQGPAWRARFLGECLVVGVLMSALFGAVYLAVGHGLEALATLVTSGALAALTWQLRRPGTAARVAHAALAVALGLFLAVSLLGPVFDPAASAWFAVVPCLAALLLRGRAVFVWLALALVALAVVVGLRAGSATPSSTVDVALVALRLAGLSLTVFIFGLRFAREQARAVRELEAASRAKSAFLATMAHELRT